MNAMKKKYKTKREHFDSQKEFDYYRSKRSFWQKTWLDKYELTHPEHRERRLIRARLYRRYYNSDCRKTFHEWLAEKYQIDNIKEADIEYLRSL